jgi:hypothetical protein
MKGLNEMNSMSVFLVGKNVEVKFPKEFAWDELTETYMHFDSNVKIVCDSVGKHILGRDMKKCEVEAIKNIMQSMDKSLQFEVYSVIELMLNLINSREVNTK